MGWVHKEICDKLDKFLEDVQNKKSPRLIICMPPRSGKLCADSTPVLTTTGWKTHGDLNVGDYVFSPSGNPIKIIAIGNKSLATHKVIFSNGEEIKVHLDHEWTIYSRPQKKYKTVETRFFTDPSPRTKKVRNLTSGEIGKRGGRYIYQVDSNQSLQFQEKKHILPPYCLGVWLGDGTSIAPRISMCPKDAQIVKNEFERLNVPITGEWQHSKTKVKTFSFASGVPNQRNSFSKELKRLNLINNKHIPNEYKYDNEKNLRELIAGLIDTDGTYIKKEDRYVFSTCSLGLANDVVEVLRLIGEIPHLRKVEPTLSSSGIQGKKVIYTVSFYPFKRIPCRLERKKTVHTRLVRRIGIVSVIPLENPEVGNCIQVDSEDGLYLVGKQLIATHNSEIVSRRFPAYALGRNPDLQIIATSYSSDLTQRFNRDVQRIIDEQSFADVFPHTALTGSPHLDSETVKGKFIRTSDLFEVVNNSGSYRSCGVGGGITGQGCEILIIDDPVKDRAEANSTTVRNSVWDWYTSTAYTRLSPGGGVIVMCTRWHLDDLIGRLIANMEAGSGDKFTVINYPAIAEKDEAHRKKGEALHPERYDLTQLLKIQKTIGSKDWSALYQQHPVPDGGAIFKSEWFRFWTESSLPPSFDSVLLSWDMTFKDSKNSDYVVGQVWGKKQGSFYLLDQVRGQWDFVKTREMFKVLASKHPKALRKLVEDKANGSAIISELKKSISGIVPVTPKESKESRANAVTPFFEAGNVFFPDKSIFPWVDALLSEFLSFPSGAHDDQIDSCTQALNYFREHSGLLLDSETMRALRRPPRF